MMPRAHRLIAVFLLLFSFLLYLKTMAPTVSFWDCGEFIATSYIMGVPHPPGSPLFLLVGRFFTLLPLFGDIGARVNLISPIASALAVMFLYLVIVQLVCKWRGGVKSVTDALITYGAGGLGALTFMVTDSHWFNAVEAEVYAVSTFLTALTVWLILRWSESESSPPGTNEANRTVPSGGSHAYYILILAYLLGLAAGIHLLNLLALPFVALIIYFRRREFTWTGFLVTVLITLAAYIVIHLGVIIGLPQLAEATGIEIVVGVLVIAVIATIWTIRRRLKNASIILTALLLVVVGYSTYITIFIRSQKDPAIDENDPETIRQAVAYLEREQYGDRPLWKGRTYDNRRGTFTEREVLLPRRYSGQSDHFRSYARYSSDADFFWNYQVKKMYMRYFLWQFAGRGPVGSKGLISRYGANSTEDGVDWFQFGLPLALLLGLFGLFYHMQRDWKHGLAVLALFLATGLMIILYLNQPDPQPRERDYSYVGSFFAWSIWIGIGVAGLMELLSQRLKESSLRRIALSVVLGVLLIIMPGVMLFANYHEHDRTGNYVAWDYSYNLLDGCEEGGIIFTNGDNDTFPLWYLQEVEGIRKDVRVINLSLLNTEWYIRQLRDFEPKLPLSLSDEDISQMSPIPWQEKTVRLAVGDPDHETGHIEWTLRPTYAGRFLRVQDRMIVQIIRDINWRRPIYFAVTVAPENKIGLDAYLEMQGLVYEVKPNPARPIINIEKLRHNLLERYRYRNLSDPSIYFNSNIQRLMQNLRASFLQLAVDGIIKGQREQARAVLDTLAVTIPESVIPVQNKDLYFQITGLYAEIGDTVELRSRLTSIPQRFRLTPVDYFNIGILYSQELGDWASAETIFQNLYAQHPQNGEVVGRLVGFYRETGHNDQAARILTDWLRFNPNDQTAKQILEEIQQQ
ncbi:MAG: protein O-mannosyl-transferase family [Candidatus Neomarinimicrobiota bacterium]